jgi:hypothetical protein
VAGASQDHTPATTQRSRSRPILSPCGIGRGSPHGLTGPMSPDRTKAAHQAGWLHSSSRFSLPAASSTSLPLPLSLMVTTAGHA